MMTTTANRERLTQLAKTRSPAALVAKAEKPVKALVSMRLFASEVEAAESMAGAMCWNRGFFMRTVFLMGWQILLAQPDKLEFFYASGVAAKPIGEAHPVPRVLAGLRLYPVEKSTAIDMARSLGMEHVAQFLRFVYLLGLQQYKEKRGQVKSSSAQ